MTKTMMVAQFLRDQAWWRLDSPGVSAIRVARSVVALLDTAVCVETLPDTHPDLERLARAGCFRGGVFDPGEAGLAVVRGWELADQPTGGEQNLLAALAITTAATVGASLPAPVHHEAPYGSALPEPLYGSAHHEAPYADPRKPAQAGGAPVAWNTTAAPPTAASG